MAHELTRVAGVASVEVTLRRWSRRARWRVYVGELERPLPDSNRGWRICNPLPYRLAKGPRTEAACPSEAYLSGDARPWEVSLPARNPRDSLRSSRGLGNHVSLQLAGKGVDALLALLAGAGETADIDLARLDVIEHHRFGPHVL